MKKNLIALALMAGAIVPAQAALTAGDIAIIGRINNGTPDSFALVALNNIAAGEVIYFTDNGWTGSGFRGATATDGDGSENLTRWTITSAISAGSIVNSTSAGFSTTGAIAGSTNGSYASLSLGQPGDQIYAFQNSVSSNPLFKTATQNHLYVFDDTGTFKNATDSNSGNVAPGLSAGSTAVSLSLTSMTSAHVKTSLLNGPAQSKEQWLATFANKANWEAGALPTGAIAITAVPEPSSYALMFAGLAAMGMLVRRRRSNNI